MTLIAAICLGLCGASAVAHPIEPQKSHHAPATGELTYDPLPGPYFASVDEKGALQDVGVAQNAIQSWRGPKLSAYILCFQSTNKLTDWNVADAGLRNVSHELRSRGAAIVVIAAERVCSTPPSASMMGNSYVEIRGVIQIVD